MFLFHTTILTVRGRHIATAVELGTLDQIDCVCYDPLLGDMVLFEFCHRTESLSIALDNYLMAQVERMLDTASSIKHMYRRGEVLGD